MATFVGGISKTGNCEGSPDPQGRCEGRRGKLRVNGPRKVVLMLLERTGRKIRQLDIWTTTSRKQNNTASEKDDLALVIY